jgi:predicted component of type VI protein secretion system
MNPLISPKTGKPIVGNVRRQVIEKKYNWGLYVYKKSDGRWFTDGEGNVLNIESTRGDIAQITKLKNAAKYYGDEGDGEAIFVPGLTRISEEEHSEQLDRMKQGLIPSMNDLGAWKAAQDTMQKHGRDAYES